ncbi:MAG: hypothetical protein IJC26_02170 [Clostridia bacterium]|nr:hypothetical protein [Clostridia bacterium]
MDISIKNIWEWISRAIVFILVVSFAFGVGAFIFNSYFVEPTYVASVKFYASGMETSPTLGTSVAPQYVEFLNVNEFYDMVSKDLLEDTGVNLTPKEVSYMLSFSSVVQETSSFFVTVRSADPNLAYNVALSVAEKAPEQVDSFADVGVLEVIENPTLPTFPTGAGSLKVGMIGIVLGFLFASFVVVLKEILDNSIKTPDEITQLFDIPVFGTVPDFSANNKKGEN